MLGKIRLYASTIRYMKPEQIFWRIGKKLGIPCALKGGEVSRSTSSLRAMVLPELDFDPVFLNRFCVEELLEDRVTFLHEAEHISWEGSWRIENRSPLWNFNLHYFEFLHPLCKRYLDTCEQQYLDKAVQMIRGWIHQNPQKRGGAGWSAYTISLRLTNWMSFYTSVHRNLEDSFRKELEDSMYQQYAYLSQNLEKNLLGNHYFENLKALVLCALFFGDEEALPVYLRAFRKECREEILPDGMHFELSPMYHKIVLEGLLRVAVALRRANMPDVELEQMAGDMVHAAYSMECRLFRTPLFNDSGDNVAKSLETLLECANRHLDIVPVAREALPESGYYFFTSGAWKLIVDAGAAGPDYIPGHSHCDAMSFELYRDGQPVLVNCGTYAYQCAERHWFRSTQAHNTVQVAGTEQSEIWSVFRLARRSKTWVLEILPNGIRMEMTDYKGNRIRREILLLPDALHIIDQAEGLELHSHLHSIEKIEIHSSAELVRSEAKYAPEYGLLETIHQVTAMGRGKVELTVPLQ